MTWLRTLLLLSLPLALAGAVVGCGRGERGERGAGATGVASPAPATPSSVSGSQHAHAPEPTAASPAPATAPVTGSRTYTVRGEVVQLSHPGGKDELMIRHEAIPDFVDARGEAVGMAAMVMPFAVPASSRPVGLSKGDKVRLRFTVDWAGPSFRVDELTRLPAGTELTFPAAAAAVGHQH